MVKNYTTTHTDIFSMLEEIDSFTELVDRFNRKHKVDYNYEIKITKNVDEDWIIHLKLMKNE